MKYSLVIIMNQFVVDSALMCQSDLNNIWYPWVTCQTDIIGAVDRKNAAVRNTSLNVT